MKPNKKTAGDRLLPPAAHGEATARCRRRWRHVLTIVDAANGQH